MENLHFSDCFVCFAAVHPCCFGQKTHSGSRSHTENEIYKAKNLIQHEFNEQKTNSIISSSELGEEGEPMCEQFSRLFSLGFLCCSNNSLFSVSSVSS